MKLRLLLAVLALPLATIAAEAERPILFQDDFSNPASGWMVVEKGKLFPKDLYVPVTAVDYLDGDGVHLRVTKDVLQNAFVVQPANVTFVATVV